MFASIRKPLDNPGIISKLFLKHIGLVKFKAICSCRGYMWVSGHFLIGLCDGAIEPYNYVTKSVMAF